LEAKRSFELPIHRRRTPLFRGSRKRGTYSGSTGLGDSLDLFYTVSMSVGKTVAAVNLDTGSSDLWVISDQCKTTLCQSSNVPAYPSANIMPGGGSVNLSYGDSLTGTHANGPVAQDTVAIAGLSMPQQPFAAISDTNNSVLTYGASGIFGLGFPSGSLVQAAAIDSEFNNPSTTDDFVVGTATNGPLLSRIAMSSSLEQPMFTIMLQRDVIDISGFNGSLTVGKLPDGIANSSLTWVPVRLYKPEDGGMNPPTFAPNEVYPFRWEVPIDGVILDGQQLPAPSFNGSGSTVSALLDTGNSAIRGPANVVNSILKEVSSTFAANTTAMPTFPCSVPHSLAFQIGGKNFSVDPRDFMSQYMLGDAKTCVANKVVTTDPPTTGALFSWSLGDPFFKSNLVAFYYGNLTHPSVDPPRIGFLSMVPNNVSSIVQDIVAEAQAHGGTFSSTSHVAPTHVGDNILLEPTSIQIPTTTSSPRPSVLAESSASQSFGRLSNPGFALCTVLLPTLFLLLS